MNTLDHGNQDTSAHPPSSPPSFPPPHSPSQMNLLDRGVKMAAEADEDSEMNFVRKHALVQAEVRRREGGREGGKEGEEGNGRKKRG